MVYVVSVAQIGKGAYNPLTTKVLHLAKNPSVEAHQGALQKVWC